MNAGNAESIIKALHSFGDADTAAKWFGRISGTSGIDEDIVSLFTSAFKDVVVGDLEKSLAKGAASSGFKGALSAGASGLAGGLSGIVTKVGTLGSGLLTALGSILPALAVVGTIAAGIGGFHLLKAQETINDLESDVADKVTEISDTAKSMKNDDGSLIDEKFKDTVASADAVVQKYLDSTDSTTAISDKMNNIFALSQFSDLKDKLIAAGKSGGTDAIQKMIDDTDGLKDAMNNAGLTADDLASSIMSIADPDAKNLEGIKKNLEDIFGKDGLGQSDFFKGKTDEELENFWDYLQDNNYNPKQMKWNEETTKKNFKAAQEAKKKTPEESATFASKFKNAAEDTATDIDTVTDNFQSDMKNIQSAMESVTNGTFQNSDMADLIQQFPELSNASGDLKDNLQNLAMNKGAEAIGKIRDSVKDVTDPKQLADPLFPEHFTHHLHSKTEAVSEILLQLVCQKIKVLIHDLIESSRLIVCELFFKSMITL